MNQDLTSVETCLAMLRGLKTSDQRLVPSPGIQSPLAELNLRDINGVPFMNAIRERPLSADAQLLLTRLYERVLIKLKGASMEKFTLIQRRWGAARRRALPRMEQLFKMQCQLAASRMQEALLRIVDARLESFQQAANEPADAHRGHSARAIAILEMAFEHAPNITQAEKYKLAEATGLQPRQVTIWNRRNRRSLARRSNTVKPSVTVPKEENVSDPTFNDSIHSDLDLIKPEAVCDIMEESEISMEHQEVEPEHQEGEPVIEVELQESEPELEAEHQEGEPEIELEDQEDEPEHQDGEPEREPEHQQGESETEPEQQTQPMLESDSESESEDPSEELFQPAMETTDASLPELQSISDPSSDTLPDYIDAEYRADNILDVWSSNMPISSFLDSSSMMYPPMENYNKDPSIPSAVLLCGDSAPPYSQAGPSSLDDAGQYLVFSPVDSMPRLDFADLDLNIDALEECFGLSLESDFTMIRVKKISEEEEQVADYLYSKAFNVMEQLEKFAKEEEWDLSSIISRGPSSSLGRRKSRDLRVRLPGISSTRTSFEDANQRLFESYPTSPMTPCLPPYSSLSQGYVAPSTQTFEPVNLISPSLLECPH